MARDYVAQARALVGVRFRPQGRSSSSGLDCIGLAVATFDLPASDIPADYSLRGGDPDRAARKLAEHFLRIPAAAAVSGDLLLVDAGAGQLHAVILAPNGYVHADAGLRRVVEVPGAIPWRILSAWRRDLISERNL